MHVTVYYVTIVIALRRSYGTGRDGTGRDGRMDGYKIA